MVWITSRLILDDKEVVPLDAKYVVFRVTVSLLAELPCPCTLRCLAEALSVFHEKFLLCVVIGA